MKKNKKNDFKNSEYFINRELSWVQFNYRVLEEALDNSVPLLERLKFLAIVSNNFDEFYMVRVAGLKQLVRAGVTEAGIDGMTPKQQLASISEEVHEIVAEQYRCLQEEVLPTLYSEGFRIRMVEDLTRVQRKKVYDYFTTSVLPVLTPLAVDSGHPFPHLIGKTLNLAILLRQRGRGGDNLFAVVQVPRMLPRLVPIDVKNNERHFVFMEDIISNFINDLFPGLRTMGCFPFRVTRDSDLDLKEDEADDLLAAIEEELRKRDSGNVSRLEVSEHTTEGIIDMLMEHYQLGPEDVYRIVGPINVCDMMELTSMEGMEAHCERPFTPRPIPELVDGRDIFSAIRDGDILVHHPYDTFQCVVDFVSKAATDPKVLAIKQTLYRTSGDSPIIHALKIAAENGKQVAALVELKARFDEENNIIWARELEEAGVHVVYGLVGLKIHCKASMVIRQEKDGLRRYVHLGTGNYHPKTARVYTDLGLFTCDPGMGQDAGDLFNLLTGYSNVPQWKKIAVSPLNLFDTVIQNIEEVAKAKKNGRIIAKMNSLVDAKVCRALYRASQAGVRIDLIVRGICCLRPEIAGVSDNIRVISIVDRFLEHSRVMYFNAGGQEKVYLSSADWMPRNLYQRVETMFPVENEELRKRIIKEVLEMALSDNVKARLLKSDGCYVLVSPTDKSTKRVRSQQALLENAAGLGITEQEPLESVSVKKSKPVFRPMTYEEKIKRSKMTKESKL
jgi:polyphosphate kinase